MSGEERRSVRRVQESEQVDASLGNKVIREGANVEPLISLNIPSHHIKCKTQGRINAGKGFGENV